MAERYLLAHPGVKRRSEWRFVVERTDDGERQGLAEDERGHLLYLVVRYRLDLREDLVHRLKPRVDELGFAEPAHPGRRILQPEDDRPAQLALAAVQLLVGQSGLDHLGDLLLTDCEDFLGLGRQAAGINAPLAAVSVLRTEAVHRIGQPALFPDLLEQAGRHAAAERRVQYAERE